MLLRADWYAEIRGLTVSEVFHRVLKTGCRVEQIQLKAAEALIKALMIYSVIASRILYLTHLGRHSPELPCGTVFSEGEWKATCHRRRTDELESSSRLSASSAVTSGARATARLAPRVSGGEWSASGTSGRPGK